MNVARSGLYIKYTSLNRFGHHGDLLREMLLEAKRLELGLSKQNYFQYARRLPRHSNTRLAFGLSVVGDASSDLVALDSR